MATPDGRHVIAFNGEIYNYLELRQELEREGCTFRSHSDTEVLLLRYARWGPACLPRLVGMFALAIVDLNRRQLFLARDFVGIKPLYYARPAKGFAFASEIKALRPLVSGQVRADRLFLYLRDGLVDHGGKTLLADVHQLPAAHWMTVDLETGIPSEPQRYWDIDLDRRSDLSFPEAVRQSARVVPRQRSAAPAQRCTYRNGPLGRHRFVGDCGGDARCRSESRHSHVHLYGR